jgi:drug/metabolite transporter (DMT)-like permease
MPYQQGMPNAVAAQISRPRVYAMLVLTMLLWAGNSIVARAIHADIPPFTLALARWTGAAVLLAPFAWKGLAADWPLVKRHWGVILALGAIGVGSFNAFLYSGLRFTTASNALLIQAGIPAVVLTLNLAVFRVRPRLAQIAGVSVAVIGVLTIIFKADPAALMALRFGPGDGMIVCAVVVWALYTILLRLRPPIRPLSFLTLTFAIGAAAMLPPALFEWRTLPVHLTPAVLGGCAYVAVFPSIVAYGLYNKAVAEIGAGEAGQAISLQPLFGALLAALLLGEKLHTYHLWGMALITLGIAAPLLTQRKTSPAVAR